MPTLLPPSLSPGALAVLLATAFIAALARGFSGFRAALIFLPLAATVTDPKIASPLLLVADESVFRRICYALIVIAVLISLPVLDGVIR